MAGRQASSGAAALRGGLPRLPVFLPEPGQLRRVPVVQPVKPAKALDVVGQLVGERRPKLAMSAFLVPFLFFRQHGKGAII